MKEFLWAWLFWLAFVFCGLLAFSLLLAWAFFSTAPNNPHTPVFAIGFGFALGFIGLGALTVFFYDRLVKHNELIGEEDGELLRKIVREMPFFFFSLVYFFVLAVYMGVFILMLPFIRNACGA